MPRHDDDDDDDRPRSRNRGDDDDDDDRPRRKKRRDDDDDYDFDRPRRKKSGGGGGSTAIIIIVVIGVVILGCGGVGFLLLLPAVQKVREAAARAQETNNMKQIGVGMHNYASANRKLPYADKNLSWRVELLPYIEQDSVYRMVDPQQAWNQGRNSGLADIAIKTYISPLDEGAKQTHYRVFVGPDTAFDSELMRKKNFPDYITDGMGNTLMAVDTAEMVPWPQPKEILFQPGGSIPELGHPNRSQGLILLCDGSVKSFDKKTMDQRTLRSMITANGGEMVPDW